MTERVTKEASPAASKRPGRRWPWVLACVLALCGAGLFGAGEYVLHHAEPVVRGRILETLAARFGAPVEMGPMEISMLRGIEVSGGGLRIPFVTTDGRVAPYPLVRVDHFAFRTSLHGLLHQPMEVSEVRVEGMEIHIPPPGERGGMFGRDALADPHHAHLRPRMAVHVQHLDCQGVRLLLEPATAGKLPAEFNMARLGLWDLGQRQPMRYEATLTVPRPRGELQVQGRFGPWAGVAVPVAGEPEDPAQTPLDGRYTFAHAELKTIRGLGGVLASTGQFAGLLNRITVEGRAEVPDFSLDVSNHPMPLQAEFRAVVDGTSGDTFLEPVQARLGESAFTVTGKVVKARPHAHDVQLRVQVAHGRVQDFLRLAARTNPPLMRGELQMTADLRIPPGEVRVPAKLQMQGSFQLHGVRFTNAATQRRLDELSARAQGRPEEVGHVREAEAQSEMSAQFRISHGVLEATNVRYALPGALVALNGVYALDGKLFEFKGNVQTRATASQMVGGWKGWLLKPLDSYLARGGAGVTLPIEITGTDGAVHLGLATEGTDATPREMLSEVRGKERDELNLRSARRLLAAADAEDAAAARAPTLQEAEKLHSAAVRDRAAARNLRAPAR